jgi:hypothetical protein
MFMNGWVRRFAGMVLGAVVLASPAWAEWIQVTRTDKDVFYLGSEKSEQFGANIMVWVLRDHVGPRYGPQGAYLSSKDQIEIDCRNRRIRLIYSSDHPQAMGEGKFIHSSHGPMSWNMVDPRSTLNRIVNLACARR